MTQIKPRKIKNREFCGMFVLYFVGALMQGHAFYKGPDQPFRVVGGDNPMHVSVL